MPSRDTGYIVRAAIQAPPGANILGAGTYASYEECLRIWCKLHEVPFGGVDNVPLEVFVSFFGSQKALGQEVGEMLQFMDEYGYAGTDKTVLPGEVS